MLPNFELKHHRFLTLTQQNREYNVALLAASSTVCLDVDKWQTFLA